MALALPLLLAGWLVRYLRGRAVPGELAERLGRGGNGPVLWLHGASHGEITSARWLVGAVMAAHPGLAVLITCNNPTARAMVQGWGLPGVQAALAPWDTRGAVARFLRHWQPRAMIVIENELWPERLAACAAAGVPVIAIGARMSAGSARNWARLAPGLMRRMLGSLTFATAQDAASETRLVALGLPPERLGPRLMLKAQAGHAQPVTATAPVARHRCLLAASTHEGEEEAVLHAFRQARDAGAFDLLILAPRHPARAPAIAALVAASGLPMAQRSLGQMPQAGTAVYLADTFGEMPLWYAMAGVTFIGGTFADKGGHTPFEPAAQGSALLHGPSVFNFAEVFVALDAAGGALAVADAASLGAALCTLDAEAQARMAKSARSALPAMGDTAPLLAAIDRALARD
nr:glycosyltransferase N-terminal domain-containing protein [Fertoeibacter niger]